MKLAPKDDSHRHLILRIVDNLFSIQKLYSLELCYHKDSYHFQSYEFYKSRDWIRIDSISVNSIPLDTQSYGKMFKLISVVIDEQFFYLSSPQRYEVNLKLTKDEFENILLNMKASLEFYCTFKGSLILSWSEEIYQSPCITDWIYTLENGIKSSYTFESKLLKKAVQDKIHEITNKHQDKVSQWLGRASVYIEHRLDKRENPVHIVTVKCKALRSQKKQWNEVFNTLELGFLQP